MSPKIEEGAKTISGSFNDFNFVICPFYWAISIVLVFEAVNDL